ncbi:DUF3772 domain-containing protein [Pseudooceanicola sp. CBS1P-1]|uniref:DUF3772 domain-containing protein n=1 Tax=Pseudooceanicola albus TaxID=2692189 RepID=A0A6L7G243_9RHOB|nr:MULTISPECIES: DUF3772 domain-containing protein [Pseudooceanicola]MBT9383663.1 DUF3772 domain-containing protein [Pseudooceanicola endophyticus]MXN17517.1 DUF3772 domain-containing protein [Pseudooceanicola albus]
MTILTRRFLLRLCLILTLVTVIQGAWPGPAVAQNGSALDSTLSSILPGNEEEGDQKAADGDKAASDSKTKTETKSSDSAQSRTPPAVPSHSEQGLTKADYETWNTIASRAEQSIQDNRASETAYEQLRSQLVTWRDQFQKEESANSTAISTVQAQLDALGPAPADGQEENEVDAKQRDDLQSRLAELQAPAKQATLAYSRADALIKSVDVILRDRQTQALITLGTSPLDLTKWPGAFDAALTFFRNVAADSIDAWHNGSQRSVFRQNLPLVIGLLGLALILLARGRDWIERLALKVLGTERSASRWLISFIVSLGQIILPVGGIVALYTAAVISGLMSSRVQALAQTVPFIGLLLFTARWVGGYIFPVADGSNAPLELTIGQRREGRVYANVLGALMALYILISRVADFEGWDQSTLVVLVFPILVVIALFLLRLSRFLIAHAATVQSEGGEIGFRAQLVMVLGRTVFIVAIVAPILCAIGYFQAARTLIFPTLLSLEMIGFLVILHRLTEEVYVLLTGNRSGVAEALLPVLVNLVLGLLSVPVFALIWGARITDLTEMWSRFVAGFTIGDTHISPADFLTFVVIFAAGYAVTRMLQKAMKTTILPKTKLDIGGRNAAVSGIGYIGIFLAALLAITLAGIDLSSLAIVAGALSVGVGFGLQTIVQNFVSGIILLIERPISEGDWIEVGGKQGFVRAISVRSTRIETFDRTDVIVPNADLISGQVTNWTRGNLIGRLIVTVGVAYGSDTRRVQKILQEVAEAQPLVLLNPPPGVVFQGFGADSLDFEIRMILRDVTQMLGVKTEINHQIAARFAQEGIEIPFAQRDIWLRNPEALHPQPSSTPAVPRGVEQGPTLADGPAPSHMRDDGDAGGDGEGDGGDR